MIYYLKELVDFLINPLVLFWILIGIFFFRRYQKKGQAQVWLMVALIWLAITTNRWMPDLLVHQLEKQYPALNNPTFSPMDTFNILVLGGGNFDDEHMPEQDKLSAISVIRLNEGLRLAHQFPHSLLVCSGFSSKSKTQAEFSAQAAIALGLHKDRIKVLNDPRTTEEEALSYKNVFGASSRFILVTSDLHMPRAIRLFNKHGLYPLAAPAGSLLKKDPRNRSTGWASEWNNLEKLERALHEYIGLVWGKITR